MVIVGSPATRAPKTRRSTRAPTVSEYVTRAPSVSGYATRTPSVRETRRTPIIGTGVVVPLVTLSTFEGSLNQEAILRLLQHTNEYPLRHEVSAKGAFVANYQMTQEGSVASSVTTVAPASSIAGTQLISTGLRVASAATTFATSTFKLSAGQVAIAAVNARANLIGGTTDLISLAGFGLTWTKVREISYNSSQNHLAVFWATPNAITSGFLEATLTSGSSNTIIQTAEFSGVATVAPIVQSTFVVGQSVSTSAPNTASVPLVALASTRSANWGALGLRGASSEASITTGSSFDELGYVRTSNQLQTEFRSAGGTNVEWSFLSTAILNSIQYAAIGLELGAA